MYIPKNFCILENCDSPWVDRKSGYCGKHHARFKKYGDPHKRLNRRGEAPQFLKELVANPPQGCVYWPFFISNTGYGVTNYEYQSIHAHRLALYFYTGKMPEGLDACHICDNPPCVNPIHMRWGTRQSNIDDAISHRRTKLKAEQIPDIRIMYEEGASYRKISKLYSVDPCTIMAAVKRRTWKHVV